jgi:predicted ATPase/class 3 adenylate cyclase
MPTLPTGTVTLLFTDIEGSTRLLRELGDDAYAEALAKHRRVLRESFARHGGVEVDTEGDAFFVAFARPEDAATAAVEAQRVLGKGQVHVRMGIHTGTPLVRDANYVGIDVHRASRIAGSGHGGQVVISQTTAAVLHPTLELRDLGEHRLKDLMQPERLYQLGSGEFPPLKTLHRANLPIQPGPLIGRERELASVIKLLSTARLVTLTGPGGSGKTRLALQAAAELVEEYRDGLWWVGLAALRDPELVEPTIAQVLGARDELAAHLRSRRALLLLDNLEQLLGASSQIAKLLADAPDVTILATSRERLGVGAEHEYAVLPMATDEAVELFTARARQLQPDFEPDSTVTEICHRLDRLPLALELAAARVKVLRPEQMLPRLKRRFDLLTTGPRDAPERQRSLRAAIEWSYELLAEHERRTFARVAVFAGSFELDAAENVAETDIDVLGSLVDKSLLRTTPDGRFFMLETIREFALERLAKSAEHDQIDRAHAGWFVALVEQAAPGLTGLDQAASLERLIRDQENARAALDWAASNGEDEILLRLAGASFRFWYLRGLLGEARTRLDQALRTRLAAPELRERVLFGVTLIAHRQGDVAAARSYATERLEVCRALGDPARMASAFIGLGLVAELEGKDHAVAAAAYEDARSEAAKAGDRWTRAIATMNLSEVVLSQGDTERAGALADEGARSFREIGDRAMLSKALYCVGIVALERGDLEGAKDAFREGLRLSIEVDDSESLIFNFDGHAELAAINGNVDRATTIAGFSEALRHETGFAHYPGHHMHLPHVRQILGTEALATARAAAIALTHDEIVASALEVID